MKVFDGSPKDSHFEISVGSKSDDGKGASSGNPIAMIRDVQAVVYWYQLD